MKMSLPAEVDQFIVAASRLSAVQFDAVRDASARVVAADPEALTAPVLPAPAFSMLNKRVREALAPRADELAAYRLGGLRAAISATLRTATVLWRPDLLTPARYAVFAEPFAQVGLMLPAHPDGQSGN